MTVHRSLPSGCIPALYPSRRLQEGVGLKSNIITRPIVSGWSACPRWEDFLQCNRHVRFGSEADMCSAKRHVRFSPNSDRESRLRQTVMSALPPIADMCGARGDVCYGPKVDIA